MDNTRRPKSNPLDSRDQYQSSLRDCLPDDSSRQMDAWELASKQWRPSFEVVVDLGCGAGDSVDFFRRMQPNVDWVGLDIEDSPEVEARRRTDAKFLTYDGVNIPLASGSTDFVFCRQVLEHVQEPGCLLHEVHRTLKLGGLFVGSTSQLEPYHSFSTCNWTAWGLKTAFEKAGLTLLEVRPGIDGMTLVAWYVLRQHLLRRFFTSESPLNVLIQWICRAKGRTPAQINAAKLYFSGHICFAAVRR
jgi:SAM-dependent methyltransferase